MKPQKIIRYIYQVLMEAYGPQGWWPVSISSGEQGFQCNDRGYHPGCYGIPVNGTQQLEIALGAVLTQNTNWKNAAAALQSLAGAGLFSLAILQNAKIEQISLAIRSAGYYNQKAKTVKNLVLFLRRHPFAELEAGDPEQVRKELLQVRGIGPETADCILLYALKKPYFVIDAYTRRVVAAAGIMPEKAGYEELRRLFEGSLEPDVADYQEYHALLVRHGKTHYSRKSGGAGDEILKFEKMLC